MVDCLFVCLFIERIKFIYLSRLSIERIKLLKLEVSGESIRFSICSSKLKIKPSCCVLVGDTIIKVLLLLLLLFLLL